MPRETLDRQIHHLQDEVLLLGSMVEQAMLSAVEALQRRDMDTAKRIYNDDHLINEKRYAIENAILILIATQQPMARDLRLMAAILEVITELERMGDYAKGIAKISLRMGKHPISLATREFSTMASLAVDMLHRALGAFISENAQQAYQIPREDDQVDELYNKVYRGLVSAMIADPTVIDQANLLMWAAHNLERMADRVTNICERTVFIATGELMEMDTDDDEDREEIE
jgi:phosphate transport system protein